MDLAIAREAFLHPPMPNRPAPFWFWNDRLDIPRLIAQFDALLAAGTGGAVLHARSGLYPEDYLTPQWFDAIRAVVDHAASLGACVWLYDELGWPSGSAGGRVPGDRADLQMVRVRMLDTVIGGGDPLPDAASVVSAFLVSRSDLDHGFQRRNDGSVLLIPDRIRAEQIVWPARPGALDGQRVLLFHRELVAQPSYLDPEPTREFIRLTHEAYLSEVGQHFGGTIRHIFMDEPGSFAETAALPWSARLEREFEQRRGYSIAQRLPALFFETPGHEAVRFDYWTLVAEMFREGWAQPLAEWCEGHGIMLSGHYLHEATLKETMRELQAPMPLYEYEGMVGVDILGDEFYSRRFEREAFGYYTLTIRQAASAGSQLGKRGLLSESYGVAGNAMGPEQMQIATNWQMAHGVTFIAQHAPFYSVRAERKLDCPPCLDWRQPWWPLANKHFDMISRTGWLMEQGEAVADVMLLHPAASMQATFRLARKKIERKVENYLYDADLPFELIDKHFTLLAVALADAQIGHEYGDEEMMARHGGAAGGRLRIGVRDYGIVVLPPLANIRSATLAMLRDFAAQGGTLIAVGSLPELVDGRPSTEAVDFLREAALCIWQGIDRFDYAHVTAELAGRGTCSATVRDAAGDPMPDMKVARRRWEGRDIVYVANISRRDERATVSFAPGTDGCVEEWDLTSGAARPIVACQAGIELTLDLEWARGQARAFVTSPDCPAVIAPPPSARQVARIQPEWTATRTAPNVLLLDECRLCGEQGEGPQLSISQARRQLAALLSGVPADAAGADDTLTHGKLPANWRTGDPVALTTRYDIHLHEADEPAGACEIALELCTGAAVSLNGTPVALDDRGEFLDAAIRRIALPGLRQGANVLEVRAEYRQAAELQSPMLLGDFAVHTADDVAFSIGAAAPVGPGAWNRVGLPFYSGTVMYRAEVDGGAGGPACVEVPGLAGSARVRVNGVVADDILWPPYRCDIALQPGTNVVEIEVAGTLRNLFGPLYEPNEDTMTGFSEPSYTAPAGARKLFREYGILTAPEIAVLETPST